MMSVAGRKEGGKVVLTNKNLVFIFTRPPRQVVTLRSISKVESTHDEIVLKSADSEIARFGIYEKDQREAWIKDIENARTLAEHGGESIQDELSAVTDPPTINAGAVDYTPQGQAGVVFLALGGTMLFVGLLLASAKQRWFRQQHAGGRMVPIRSGFCRASSDGCWIARDTQVCNTLIRFHFMARIAQS